MGEVLTELFTGFILEGSLGRNIRFIFFKLFGKNYIKEELSNEYGKKQKIFNGLIVLLFLITICFIIFMFFYLIFGNH
ncbi:hypothetical protein SAMN06296427_11029 [Moheibacter sediminis]|uniref:Uncharacterized protein n=1 Tax=Moheibacter sediminis TaxID=1434700 RepID=A0A1W2CFI8_9FLAO|nr:hypothetical protein SAMN06296427_11029 [Moheibacter sediminis]